MKLCVKKVVLVTGVSSGIGKDLAQLLSEKGFVVYGVSRRDVVDAKFHHIKADVCDHERMVEVFEQIIKEQGRIDVVVNNAGMGIGGAVEDTTKDLVEKIFSVNVLALMDICSLAVGYLRESRGKIINIGSVAGVVPIPFQSYYSATKAAVESFSLALANEVRDFGVGVCCVRPGDTKTGFTAARIKNKDNKNYNDRIQNSIKKMEKDEQNGVGPRSVSKVVFRVINKKKTPLVKTVGVSYKFVCWLIKILPMSMANSIIKKIYG